MKPLTEVTRRLLRVGSRVFFHDYDPFNPISCFGRVREIAHRVVGDRTPITVLLDNGWEVEAYWSDLSEVL